MIAQCQGLGQVIEQRLKTPKMTYPFIIRQMGETNRTSRHIIAVPQLSFEKTS